MIRYDCFKGASAYLAGRDETLPEKVVQMHQVHGDAIVIVDEATDTSHRLEGYDAMITRMRGIALGVRTADCVPVLLHDPVRGVIAAVHSGWKGTVKRISASVIARMRLCFGTDPADVVALVGPAIGPGSFQVGREVVDAFEAAGLDFSRWDGKPVPGSMKGGWHIDLWRANRQILLDAGVKAENVFVQEIDTYTDLRLYSARREGLSCGRNINVIRLDA